jgi:hypothetical protein
MLRRKFMETVDRDYISKKLALRKGKCLKCGKCCLGCKYLDEKTKKCKVYKNRPWYCHKDFPIDNLDLKVFGVKNCGYRFG